VVRIDTLPGASRTTKHATRHVARAARVALTRASPALLALVWLARGTGLGLANTIADDAGSRTKTFSGVLCREGNEASGARETAGVRPNTLRNAEFGIYTMRIRSVLLNLYRKLWLTNAMMTGERKHTRLVSLLVVAARPPAATPFLATGLEAQKAGMAEMHKQTSTYRLVICHRLIFEMYGRVPIWPRTMTIPRISNSRSKSRKAQTSTRSRVSRGLRAWREEAPTKARRPRKGRAKMERMSGATYVRSQARKVRGITQRTMMRLMLLL
jgi:hypothetical protein